MFKKIFFILIAVFLVLPFQNVKAEEAKEGGLVPCGHDRPCTTCDLIVGIKGVIDFLTRLMVFVGLFVITIAGVIWIVSAGDSGLISKAKSAIKNVLIGIVVVLTAWLVIVFIMGALSADDIEDKHGGVSLTKKSAWSFECSTESNLGKEEGEEEEEKEEEADSEVGCGNSATPSCNPGVVIADLYIGLDEKKHWKCQSTDGKQTIICTAGEASDPKKDDKKEDESQEEFREEQARNSLDEKSNGLIRVWESAAGKTNIRDLKSESKNGILDFQEKYGKGFLVTGGADEGKVHKNSDDPDAESHANGYKVDIQKTAAIDNFLVGNKERGVEPYLTDTGKSWSNGTKLYTDPNGNIWAKEGTHWDVCFNCKETSKKWGF